MKNVKSSHLLVTRNDLNTKFLYITEQGDIERRSRKMGRAKSSYNIVEKFPEMEEIKTKRKTVINYDVLTPEEMVELDQYLREFALRGKGNKGKPGGRIIERKREREMERKIEDSILKINEYEIKNRLLDFDKKFSLMKTDRMIDKSLARNRKLRKITEKFEKIDMKNSVIQHREGDKSLKPSNLSIKQMRFNTLTAKKMKRERREKIKMMKSKKEMSALEARLNTDALIIVDKESTVIRNISDMNKPKKIVNMYKAHLKNLEDRKFILKNMRNVGWGSQSRKRKFRPRENQLMNYKIDNDEVFKAGLKKRIGMTPVFLSGMADWKVKRSSLDFLKIRHVEKAKKKKKKLMLDDLEF